MEENSDLEAEFEEIHKQFPNAQFSIDIPLKLIDEIVLKTNKVAVKCDFNCYCYSQAPRKTEYFILKSQKGITNRDLINCLIENNFNPRCEHNFLEEFSINTESQVTAWFGS
jgi:hypothetical protein